MDHPTGDPPKPGARAWLWRLASVVSALLALWSFGAWQVRPQAGAPGATGLVYEVLTREVLGVIGVAGLPILVVSIILIARTSASK